MSTISYNFGIAALSRLILGGISLIVVGFLTRSLGPAGYGNYSLIFAYLYIFTTLADLGLYTILIREISRPGSNETKIISNIFSLRLAATVLFLIAGIIIGLFLPYSKEVKLGIMAASIFAALSSLYQVLTGIFQKYLRLYYVSMTDVASRLVQLLLIFVVVKSAPSLLAFIWVVVISELVHFSLLFWFTQRLVKFKIATEPDYWIEILKTSVPVALSLIFTLLYFKMDTVLLSLMKPAQDVGIYSVAYKVLEVVIFLPAIYIGLLMPSLSKHAYENMDQFVKTYRKGFDTLAIFALPVMTYLFFRAADIIKIMGGEKFSQASTVLEVLSIASILIFFGNLGGNSLVALDLQKKGMWIYFGGAIFNVAANLLLIPRYSYFATAWTTVLTEFLITIAMFWLIKKEAGATLKMTIFWKAALATVITSLILQPLKLGFIPATISALMYFPILFLLGGISRDDLRELTSLKATTKTVAIPED